MEVGETVPEVVQVIHDDDNADIKELLAASKENGKGVVVLVTMDGCEPCRRLKERLKVGDLKKALDNVNFGIINRGDRAVKPYLQGSSFPQLFKVFKDKDGKDLIVRVVGNVEDKRLLDVINRE